MKLKTTFEILNNDDKRVAYDLYGTIDFSYEEQMKQALEIRFKHDKNEQEKQFKAFKVAKDTMRVFGEVVPYYFTWLLLTIFRIDRQNSFNILVFLIILIAVFEIAVRIKYGQPESNFDIMIRLLYNCYPRNFTIGENMKLTR